MSDNAIYYWHQLVLFSAFILSAYLLENLGIQYVSEGGSAVIKIHFYSYLLMLLTAFICITRGINHSWLQLGGFRLVWLLSIISIAIVIVYGLIRFGTSGMAYLIDTIFVPLLLFFTLAQLNTNHKIKLLRFIAYMLLLNSVIAILEFAMGTTLMAVEFAHFSFFRSTALLNFPLNNALITAALTPILLNHTRLPALAYFAISFLALFAFGGRAALAIFIVGMLLFMLPEVVRFFSTGVKVTKVQFALIQGLFFFLIMGLVLILALTPIGARVLSKLYIDNSAQARFDVFTILDQLTVEEWLFGASQQLINNIAFYIDINVIENYIIGWVVSFGLLCTMLLMISCYSVAVNLAFKRGIKLFVPLLVFVSVSVTNNALTSKTPALLLLFSSFYLYATCRIKR
ncbi:VpsF family polysaccharide biosynthesis protein [Pseudoalteromonas sp. MMG010]|uniref:VpsF family polysaccharide biosynthesis protein n=1 Tax=Pseudoalteromonas sp. MMG010 TaxID=2822685 RepID=UPI001B3A3076|nr:VpsF family polysaccharide biosynthesis protein [Pseudoalteromonas sp. MMG010]MBQ4834143.1 VpsF family polysaccharide biosynthesis protein [Pseudoalteromonas sp. MMG010]